MSQPYDTPLFGDPDQPGQRVQSHKEKDDAANKVIWRRYKIAGIVCWEWINGHPPAAQRCGPATWLRVQGPDQRALCSRHKQEYLDRDTLNAPRGGQ